MPRKSSKRDTSTKEKESNEVKVVEQETAKRRSGRAATKSDSGDPERSRRSSTAAQTAVSAADSKEPKVTKANSPPEGRRSSRREVIVESSPARARSARRNTGQVNYKESDGEEEASTPKNEDNFDSNEEYDDSDSDEAAKQKSKKPPKSPPKNRGGRQKTKTSTAGSRGRGRPTKKKGETVLLSDDSADDLSDSTYGEKKSKSSKSEDSKGSRKRPKKSSTTDSGDKPGRRSSARGSVGTKASSEPINRRPTRNKQIKKYTEVDEDFSDAKSEDEEVEYETEVKRETSRKRKREKVEETASVKKPKREKGEVKDESAEETSEPEEKPPRKKKGSKHEESEDDDSEEPMEVDEDDSNSPADKKNNKTPEAETDDKKETSSRKKSSVDKKAKDDVDSDDSENFKDIEADEENKADEGKKKENLPKDETEDTQHSKTSSQYSEDADDSLDEDEEPKASVKPCAGQAKSDEAMDLKTTNCLDSKPENTFPPKDTILETSMNGENEKSTTVPPVNASPQSRDDLPPKQNGSNSPQRTDNFSAVRRYHVNPSLSEDFRSSLKEKTFGIASYNLQGSESINKDKLVQELSKLQASVICLQDVPKDLYNDTLESNLDILGFKGVGSWPKGSQHTGIATFYKTSVFRLIKSTETSLQKLIEKDIELSNLEENKRESIFRHLSKCGNALFLHLSTMLADRHLVVGNAELPATGIRLHTMQLSCLSQEIVNASEEMQKPHILCGELNVVENKIPYQLLRHGCLTEGMVDELKSKAEDSFSEAAAFESFLKKASMRPSCKMSSCYATVLGKELLMPSSEITSSNLVWFSPDSLHTIGVLDVSGETNVSLKADIAFSV